MTPAIATNWQGPESLKSGIAAITAATLALNQTLFGLPLPQNATGSLAGFAANEGVTYRLDSATTLTGSPASVGATGTATISSLTIPSTSDGAHTVYALGNASPFASQASAGIVIDTMAPTAGAQPTPAANAAGWNNTSPVQVALSATDGSGSGVSKITYTTDGTNPTTSGTAQVYSAVISVAASSTIKYIASDIAGNASSVQTQLIKIDSLAPVNALTLSNLSGGALMAAGTVYYRGSATGSSTLTNALTDTGGSGAASSATAGLAGTSTGFLHNSSLVATPAGGPYVSNTFSWSAGTTSSPTETVTGSDTAGNSATTVLAFVPDTAGPSGGSVDATGLVGTGARYSTTKALSVAFSAGSDGGSGINAGSRQLLRAAATLTSPGTADGACGTYGAYAQVGANDPSSPTSDTVASDHTCYRYEYVVSDNVGNSTTYTSSDIKVDTTAPAGPALAVSGLINTYASGSAVYYRPAASGSVTVTGTAGDLVSGIASFAFPTLGTSGWTATPGAWGVDTYSYSVNPGQPVVNQNVTASNNAGLSSPPTAFTIVSDGTAPSGGSVTYTDGYYTSASVSVSFSPVTDSGSGINAGAAVLQRASATLAAGACGSFGGFTTIATAPTSPYVDTSGISGTCYKYQYLVSDNVGNQTTNTSASVAELATVPSAPMSIAGTAGDLTVAVSWSAPPSNGGSSVTGYTATASPGGANCTATTTSCTISGLTDGVTESITVTAANAVGAGPASTAVTSTPYPATLFTSVTGLSLWLDGADPTKEYTASTCTGGTPAVGVAIGCWQDKSSAGENFVQATGGSQPAIGTAPNGLNWINFTTATQLLMSINATDTYRTVFILTRPQTTPSGYDYVFGQSGSANDFSFRVAAGSTPFSNPNVNDWAYQTGPPVLGWSNGRQGTDPAVGVTSILTAQAAGAQTYSASVSSTFQTRGMIGYVGEVIAFNTTMTTPQRRTVEDYLSHKWGVSVTPDPPGTPTATTPGTASALVSWTAPAYNGGASVSGYTVTASPGAATCTTTGATTCTVPGLTSGQSYTFTVTAANSVGTGPASSASATIPAR